MPDKAPAQAIIRTRNGQLVDLMAPTVDMLDAGQIIVPLARLGRFANQTLQFYSVAEHSVMVSHLVEEMGGDPWAALWHDASEAYLGDITSPLKAMLPDYRAIEHKLMTCLAAKLGFEYPFDAILHKADRLLCEAEGLALVPNWKASSDCQLEISKIRLSCLQPDAATQHFQNRAQALFEKRTKETLAALGGL